MIYFGGDDTVAIDSRDASFLLRRLGMNHAAPTIKTAIFWVVIAAAVILVFLATRVMHS